MSPSDGVTGDTFDGEIGISAGEDIAAVWPTRRFELVATAIDYVPGPDLLAYRWSVVSASNGLANSVLFDYPTALETGVEFPAAGTYQLQLTATDGFATRADTLTVTLGEPLAPNAGSILAEVYDEISGSWVKDLLAAEKFPDAPDRRFQLRSTEIESNQADRYGMLIRGYLHPPVTGVYRFNIASDDWSEVFISPDEYPANKEMACFVPKATDYYEWRKFPDYQLSRPIELTAGQSYYIEIRYKESGWRDHMALAWLAPGSGEFEVIDGAFLSPWLLADSIAPEVTLTGAAEVVVEVGNEFVDPGFVALDGVEGDVSDQVDVSGSVDTGTPGEYLIRYSVRDASGNESTVATRRVRVVLAPGTQSNYPVDASTFVSNETWTPPAQITALDASRFLKQATFGPTAEEIERVRATGFEAWIDEQLAISQTSHLKSIDVVSQYEGARSELLKVVGPAGSMEMMPGSMMEMPMRRIRTDDRLWAWWTASASLRHRISFGNVSPSH